MLSSRRVRHDVVSASLAARDEEQLAALVDAAATRGVGAGVGVGGGASVLDVDGMPVFAKRIPITERELAHPLSTADLFDLPLFCRYGLHRVAVPGVNAWRELAANQTVTEAVLEGEPESFAMLHHWRVLPGRPPVAPEHQDIDAVVARLGGDPAVRTRLEEMARASSSLVLFLEHVPDSLLDRLDTTEEGIERVEQQLFAVVDALRHRQLLHLDGHFANLRADDDRIYLVDFGLATSPRFALSEAERDFAKRHLDHDADYAAMRLVNWLVTTACGIPSPTTGGPTERNAYVRRCAEGHIPAGLSRATASILARHAPAAARMNDFHWRLVDGDIHAQYPGRPHRPPG